MPLPQDHTSDATHGAAAVATVDSTFPRATGATGGGKTVESLGHMSGSLQTFQTGAVGTATVLLQGSNDKVHWTTVATNAHAGNDLKEALFVDKPYRYFRANKSVDGGAGDVVDYYLRLTGMAG